MTFIWFGKFLRCCLVCHPVSFGLATCLVFDAAMQEPSVKPARAPGHGDELRGCRGTGTLGGEAGPDGSLSDLGFFLFFLD